ncbi:GNAT family N-acetyltransferase [Clostridium perfringens]|nr:GNAT family N-acetyltransferase [Clostridium perfringens]
MVEGYKILSVEENLHLKDRILKYVENCGWGVKPFFQEQLELGISLKGKIPHSFVMLKGEEIIGFYQFIKNEPIRNMELTPWIATLFIDKNHRGQRLSEKLISHGRRYAHKLGYNKVYISTEHIQLYEKMGFREIGLDIDKWGSPTKLYEIESLEN